MHESEKWKWSHSVVSYPQRPHGLQPSRLLHPWDFPGKSTGVGCHCLLQYSQASLSIISSQSYSNSCPSSWWCLQSFPASGSFPMNQFFTSRSQSVGDSVSASVLTMNIQDWFPLGWTSWISLQFKGLSRVLSNTTVQKHQFFGAWLSLWSNSHTHTWLLEKP